MRPGSLGPTWLLVALSVLADLLGIFSFLGLDANRTAQIVAMIVLGLVAIAAATAQLVTAVRLSLSLRGAYYHPGALRVKILGSLLAFLVATTLVVGAAVLAFDSDDHNGSSDPPQAAATLFCSTFREQCHPKPANHSNVRFEDERRWLGSELCGDRAKSGYRVRLA